LPEAGDLRGLEPILQKCGRGRSRVELYHAADHRFTRRLVPVPQERKALETEAVHMDVMTEGPVGEEELRRTDIAEELELAIGIKPVTAPVAMPDHLEIVREEGVRNLMADGEVLSRRRLREIKDDLELLPSGWVDERIVPGPEMI
jgi:hypothetical protein